MYLTSLRVDQQPLLKLGSYKLVMEIDSELSSYICTNGGSLRKSDDYVLSEETIRMGTKCVFRNRGCHRRRINLNVPFIRKLGLLMMCLSIGSVKKGGLYLGQWFLNFRSPV